ncbi:Xaa-Pro peptidase family protein [Bacillus sp. AFS055030]|uniref:M24 family metallopeptidase n=1 Tax=Bacillus sp. AFS055030 TaxID=2033507 RepID=UPI000BFDC699|nr:Xaa-Pro peptidase family protein [Bacillus sp. AFS055030]PGL69142.1 peptidase M24 family protein [Bacillus sp. AFS055030]
MEHRIQNLSTWLKEQDIQLGFITSTENVFYLTNFHCNPHERLLACLVFPNEEPILVCPQMEVGHVQNAGWKYGVIGFNDSQDPWAMIQESLAKRNISVNRMAIEKEHLLVGRYERLVQLFPGAQFLAAEEKLHDLRLIKDSEEIRRMQVAAEAADMACQIIVDRIAEGKTEMDLIAEMEYEMKKKGISKTSFSTLILTGANSALPHGNPGTNPIKKGDFVLMDLGFIVDGYCSDITRTVMFGQPNEQQREIYETVLKGQLAAIEVSKPGEVLGNVDRAARQVIANAGYGEYFVHRIGHGLGIGIHDYPSVNDSNTDIIKTGMSYTIEPGIYVPNIGGVRIEDDIVITETGAITLTKFPKELIIL